MRRRSRLALTLCALLASAAWAVETPQPAGRLLQTFVWVADDPRFGGMSAIDLAADGAGFVALSDRGGILSGRIRRDDGGQIAGIDAGPMQRLRGRDGNPLPKPRSDSEGLAVAPDGTVYVSFEIAPRVLRYDRPFGASSLLPIPRDFDRMKPNGALEALAIAPDGALYTLAEQPDRRTGAHPVYRFRDGRWDVAFTLPPPGAHRPVGADFGPDGRLYLLERSFGVSGFATRVRRFSLTDAGIDGGIDGAETLIDTAPGTHGNLEGLSVWRDPGGGLRLTMVSDNNFHSFLPTTVVEYAVPD